VSVASELVDDVGPGAFSMRQLAERLHTSTATLYRHVAGKDELMVYVVDRLFAEIEAPSGEEKGVAGWQETASSVCLSFHHALTRHPNLLSMLVTQIPIGPNALAIRERTIAALVRSGLAPGLAARAFTALAHYVIGFAALQDAPDAPGPEEASALGEYYRRLDPALYPSIVAAADDLTAVPLEDEFLEGLRFILDGIGRARRPGARPMRTATA
jgi:AcrR family transcriptional regulator